MPHPTFRLLGPLEVRLDGRVVDIGSAKQRALLSALLLEPNRVVAAGTLVGLLWGEQPPASVAVTLRSVVSRLRRALGAQGRRVQARDGGYVLRVDPQTVDVRVFEDLAARGCALLARGRHGEAAALLTQAMDLWRGPVLTELPDAEPLRGAAERLAALRRDVVEELAEAQLGTGDAAQALALLEPYLAEDPLRERARGQQMRALYRLGRQTEALAAYRDLRATLRDELCVEPHPDLRRLNQQILRHDPALAPPRHAAGHLPAALTALVGRERERAELAALLGSARLVTLTGVGGVGKTRLALQVATDVHDTFPEGVRLVELAALQDAERLAVHVTEAFDAATGDGPDVLDRLCDTLHGQRLLVVVDNCEHLAAAAAAVVDRLLRAVPGMTVLATSRAPLGLTGEVLRPVPPLSLPAPDAEVPAELAASDAVTLFCRRARDAQTGFGLTADNAAAVAAICRRLDGLPLALELAAARMRALGAAQLAARLADRFALLTSGEPTAPGRQQTLCATIDWSYQLLTPAEQAALRALTVFPAGFDLDAAEAVIGPTGAPDVILRLVDKSVVTARHRRGEVRYELLESIRSFAREQAAPAETQAAHRRHLDHFADLVEREQRRHTNWDTASWCRTVAAEEPNLRAAIATALTCGDTDAALRIARGYWTHCMWSGRVEPLDWLDDALAAAGDDLATRCEGVLALAHFTTWWELGPQHRSEQLYAQARQLADRTDDDHCRARVSFFHGEYLTLRGRHAEARTQYRRAFRFARGRGISRWCHHSLAWLALAETDPTRAADELRTALDTGPPDELVVPHALAALAILTAANGDHAQARALAERAVEAAAPFALPGVQTMTTVRAAQTHALCGEDISGVLHDLFDQLHRASTRGFIAESLELAALHSIRGGAAAAAARYLGARDALRQARAEPGPSLPALGALVDDIHQRISTALGPTAYATAAAEGAATSTRHLIAEIRAGLRTRKATGPPPRTGSR